MAKLYGEIAASDLLTLDKSFARALGQPLDSTEVYYSIEAAETFAAGANAYVGQKIVVVATDPETEAVSVTHYSVEPDGTLKELGARVDVDANSIVLDKDGKLALKGFDAITDAEIGYLPRIKKVEATGDVAAHYEIEWVPVSDVVEGDTNTVTKGDNKTIDTSKLDDSKDELTATLHGFADATEGQIAAKGADGNLTWVDQFSVPENTYDEYGAAENAKKALVGADSDSKDADSIYGAKAFATDAANTAETNAKAYAEGLVEAIPDPIDYTVTVTATSDDRTTEGDEAPHSAFKHYAFSQCGKEIACIDIPTDLVVQSGSVKTVETEGTPYAEAKVGDLYIELVIANQDTPIYIPAKALVDVYTAAPNAAKVQIAIDNDNNLISASIVAGSIEETDLEQTVQDKLNQTWEEVGTAAELIADLDFDEVTVGEGKTVSTIKQVDGKIEVGEPVAIKITASQVSDFDTAVAAVKVTNAGNADTLTDKPTIANTDNKITIAVGGKTSDAVEVSYAADAGTLGGKDQATIVAEITADKIGDGVTGFTTGGQVSTYVATAVNGKANSSDVYTKDQVYTQVETRDEIAAQIAAMTGGESAADVLLALNNYKKANDAEIYGADKVAEWTVDEENEDGETVKIYRPDYTANSRLDANANLIAAIDVTVNGKAAVEEEGVVVEPAVVGLVAKVGNIESDIADINGEIADLKAVGAEANVINAITVNGTEILVENKVAKIEIEKFELEVATAETLGGVKSSTKENEIDVAADGVMTVNSVNVSKLTQTAGDVLILNGGNAAD